MQLDCKLFTNDIITAEVLNHISKKLFVNDIKYSTMRTETLNSLSNINLIISCFSKHDRKIIKEKKYEKFNYIPYNKYFYNISKSPWKKDLLKIYYNRSVELYRTLVKSINLDFLIIDKHCINMAMTYIKEYMMSINDAYHITCCECNNINYLISLDSDFEVVDKTNVALLKI